MFRPTLDLPTTEDLRQVITWSKDGITTWHQVVSVYIPGISERAAHCVLWEYAGYPLASVRQIVQVLEMLRDNEVWFGE